MTQAVLTMHQLVAGANYQRASRTEGGLSLGAGVITVLADVTTTGSVNARIRASDGTTILKDSFALDDVVTTGSGIALAVAGVDARLGWFYVDIEDASGWQLGSSLVGMGENFGISGQSLAVAWLTKISVDTSTIASSGVTITPYGTTYVTTEGVTTPAWRVPSDDGPINSAGVAHFLAAMVAALGVNCAVVGATYGATSISEWIPGGDHNAELRSALDGSNGFLSFIEWQGHQDAPGGAYGDYLAKLPLLFADIDAHNVMGPGYARILSAIPNKSSTAYGTETEDDFIRMAQRDYAAANADTTRALDFRDLTLGDGVHPLNTGNITAANHFYRALRPFLGLSGGFDPPVVKSVSRAAGGRDISFQVALTGSTALSSVGAIKNRFVILDAEDNQIAISAASVAGSTITATMATTPVNTKELRVFFGYTPESVTDGASAMVYDNHVSDGDGLNIGRPLLPMLFGAPIGITDKCGIDLTVTGTTPDFSVTHPGFGQMMGPSGAAPHGEGSKRSGAFPAGVAWTVECFYQMPAAPNNAILIQTPYGYFQFNGDLHFNATSGDGVAVADSAHLTGSAAIHHIALVNSQAGLMLYWNGQRQQTAAALAPIDNHDFGDGNFAFVIGAFNSLGFRWTGSIGSVAIWNKAVATGASFPVPTAPYLGFEDGLTAYYPLNGDVTAAALPPAPTTYALSASVGSGTAVTITATLDGTARVAEHITLNDGGAGGAFSGALTIPAGHTSGTVVYTAAGAGSIAISGTNDGGLTDGAAITVTIDATGPIYEPISEIWEFCRATLPANITPGASLLTRSRDPGDRRPIHVDWSTVMPAHRQIGTIDYLGFDNLSGTNGFGFIAAGDHRPTIDRAQKLVNVFPYCAPAFQQAGLYSTKFLSQPRMRITLLDDEGAETDETLEQGFPFTVEQRG